MIRAIIPMSFISICFMFSMFALNDRFGKQEALQGPPFAINCYALNLDFDMDICAIDIFSNEEYGKKCTNYSDIRIEFDGKEHLFSCEELKELIKQAIELKDGHGKEAHD